MVSASQRLCKEKLSLLLCIVISIVGDLAVTIIKGPIRQIVGIVYGFIMGGLSWYLPAKDCVRRP